jgi:pyruvate formate lyase activating enzyme
MAYTNLKTDILECRLCPHNCNIKEGTFGICSVRKNENSELKLPFKSMVSAINVDPIEKKPLYHFFPGSKVLSVGFLGCNFHCQFCQNHSISQNTASDINQEYVSPLKLISLAEQRGLNTIAYTYSEPVIHFEYIMECSLLAHKRGIKNVLVTNGFLNCQPANELLEVIDGVNIDLKAFTNTFYSEIGGNIKPVQNFIKIASNLCHTEVTTLVIPGKNDSEKEIMDIAGFIASVNPDIPLHLSCYYPDYNYKIQPTSTDQVLSLAKKASETLKYVYPGNIGSNDVITKCSTCGNTLIKRHRYSVLTEGITNKSCSNCHTKVPFQL